jgi:O-antigen ligase
MPLRLDQLNKKQQTGLFTALFLSIVGLLWGIFSQEYWVCLIPVGVLVLYACWLYTESSLLIFGAFAPLAINFEDLGGGLGLSLPTEPIYILLFVLLVLHILRNQPIKWQYLKHPVVIFVSLYLIWIWISTVFSSMPVVSAKFSLARTWYITLFFYIGLYIFSNYDRIHFFIKWFTAFTLIMVTYTLLMHAQYDFSRSASYGISWPFFPDHGMYAAAIAYGFFTLLIYAFYVRQFGWPIAAGPVILMLFLVLVFAIVVSFTRATWLSIMVAAGAWLLTRFRVKFYWIVIAFLTIGTVAIIKQNDIQYALEANKQGSSDELEGHVKSVSNISTDPSNLERINRWKCAARMVSDRPWFGFGPGTYVFQYAPFQKSSELTLISTHAGDLGDAHSEYFSTMSETGFLGMFFWIGIVFSTLSTAFQIVYTTESLKIKLTTYIVFLGLVCYHAHAVLNNYSQYDKLAVPLWSFTAMVVALDFMNKRIHGAQKTPSA